MSDFTILKTATGFVFHLRAANHATIATSEVYNTLESCHAGIASVRKNAPLAAIEDGTTDPVAEKTCPKFELYKDKAGEYRFRLKARNGQNIAASEGYTTKESCLNGIDSVAKNAPEATVNEEALKNEK